MAGIYIHIPYCKQKCHYCDFHFSVSLRTKDDLIRALKKELILRKDEIDEAVETIYFGGGTPSLLVDYEIKELLDLINNNYDVIKDAEITLEANPDDLTQDYLEKLTKTPVNRLSIGVQSFFDEDLRFMNRAHTAEEAINSIKYAQSVGFENITIDLIYGTPGLSITKWKQNLATFLELNIPHLSSYALTVEDRTALDYFIKTKKIPPLNDALSKQHFEILISTLEDANYWQYELSNFAKDSFLSKHNSAYWQNKKYLGFGPSAHSYNTVSRSWNVANNSKYIKLLQNNILPGSSESLTLADRYNEYIMTGLRTMWGVSFDRIRSDFGIKYLDYFKNSIEHLVTNNQLRIVDFSINLGLDKRVTVSKEALFVIDGIISDLFYID